MDAPKGNLEREAQGLDHQHPAQQRTSHGVARLVSGMAAVQAQTCCVRDLGTREFGHSHRKESTAVWEPGGMVVEGEGEKQRIWWGRGLYARVSPSTSGTEAYSSCGQKWSSVGINTTRWRWCADFLCLLLDLLHRVCHGWFEWGEYYTHSWSCVSRPQESSSLSERVGWHFS